MRELKTEKIPIRVIVSVGLILAILIFGSIIVILVNPGSRTATIIGGYQTYFGGVIALIAALITVVVIYAAASLPVRAENARILERRISDREIGAAILSGAINAMISELLSASIELEHTDSAVEYALPEIAIPELLRNLAIYSTQPASVAKDATYVVSRISFLNALGAQQKISKEDRERLNDIIKAIIEHTQKLLDDLGVDRIAWE